MNNKTGVNKVNTIKKSSEYIMNTYAPFPIVIKDGDGVYVKDNKDNEYLDFVAGIAVNCLGYKNKSLIDNLTKQVGMITHCSNLYYNEPSIEVAEKLVKNSGLDKVFYCNSGAESVEAALKLARKYASKFKGDDCYEIITMKKSFHGRTFGAVTATGQEKYQKGLTPLLPGIKYAEFNNIDSVKEIITDKTCAIVVEPVQGEGGIVPAQKTFLEQLRKICDEKNIVLIFDEVQCGIGRLGTLFAYQTYNVKPDVVCLAKGLGAGIPIGAIIANDKVAKGFEPGDHASTFGGNMISTTAANVVIDELTNNGVLDNVNKQAAYLSGKLNELMKQFTVIKEVRGKGLMMGIELTVENRSIIQSCIDKGLLLVGAGLNVIRFVPPLVIEEKDIDKAISILSDALKEVV